MPKKLRVLIIGSGGREHALYETIGRSPLVYHVMVLPGNAGIPLGDRHWVDLSAPAELLFLQILSFAKLAVADMVVVGPEQPLVDGVVDYFAEHAPNIKIFGPSKASAQLEGSKVYCKEICTKYGIPTADYRVASNVYEADLAIMEFGGSCVVKADGLAGGKGVKVAQDSVIATAFVRECMEAKVFGNAGKRIVIERVLEGRECSVMAIVDGESALMLQPARDYKRAYPGKDAPNTGGMGAYSPLPDLPMHSPEFHGIATIIMKLVSAMAKEGHPYHGLLYAGIMLTKECPMLLEVNCRFGDPETQVVLPRLDSDLVPAMLASTELNGISNIESLRWKKESAVCVVMTSGGYPGKYDIGFSIKGLEAIALFGDVVVYEAGTELRNKQKVTSGGRVLGVVGMGKNLEDAQNAAYEGVELIFYAKEVHRSDIGD